MDTKAAIERLIESKGIDLSKDTLIRKGVEYLKNIITEAPFSRVFSYL